MVVRGKVNNCIALLVINILLFSVGVIFRELNMLYLACTGVILTNIVAAGFRWRKNIVFIFFNICIYLFCLSKPLASYILGYDYWSTATEDSFVFSFSLIFVSLCAFSIVICFYRPRNHIQKVSDDNMIMQKLSYGVYLFGSFAYLYEIVGMLSYYRTHTYLEFYNGGYNRDYIPMVVKIIIQFQIPAMCMCLATKPSRKRGYFILFLYLISNIPMLITGRRAAFVLSFMFCVVYSIIRDSETYNQGITDVLFSAKQWLGKRTMGILLMIAPLAVLGLTLMNEFRNKIYSSTMVSNKIRHPIAYFLYEQGSTLDLLNSYYSIKESIPNKLYFFGSLYDTFFHNDLVARLFGIQVYSGTTEEYLLSTHTIAAQLSYRILGSAYFSGNSVDSSYLIDMYVDFGWIGVFLISIILAIFTVNISEYLKRGWLTRTIVLYCLLGIFMMPRMMFMSCFSFIVSPYFWMTISICYISINLFAKTHVEVSRG